MSHYGEIGILWTFSGWRDNTVLRCINCWTCMSSSSRTVLRRINPAKQTKMVHWSGRGQDMDADDSPVCGQRALWMTSDVTRAIKPRLTVRDPRYRLIVRYTQRTLLLYRFHTRQKTLYLSYEKKRTNWFNLIIKVEHNSKFIVCPLK